MIWKYTSNEQNEYPYTLAIGYKNDKPVLLLKKNQNFYYTSPVSKYVKNGYVACRIINEQATISNKNPIDYVCSYFAEDYERQLNKIKTELYI